MTISAHPPTARELRIGEEASEWLLHWHVPDPELKSSRPRSKSREKAFLDWIGQSKDHVRIYFETRETLHRLKTLDALHRVDVEEMLAARHADIIPLFGYAQPLPSSRRRRLRTAAVAAGVAILTIGSAIGWHALGAQEFSTAVGEQRTCKLEDGSFVYLNTDSRIRVDFTKAERHVELVSGEALFVVEHNPTQPFIVSSGKTDIRAVGTQFNVRRHAGNTRVAVVEGVVQVSEGASSRTHVADMTSADHSLDGLRLTAGEEAQVSQGHLSKRARGGIAETMAWRQRRLVFHRAPLANVAAEFNRYNRVKITVDNLPAGGMQLTGIFDADRPMALVRYAQQYGSLVVEPRGNDWVIRARETNAQR